MKRILTLLCLSLITTTAIAKPVKNIDQAIDLVEKSIVKNKLTTLKPECLLYSYGGNDIYYEIDVRENHNEICGGDPQTAPRLMTYQVHKKTAKLCTDSIAWAEKLKAEDPYDFECRPIK